MKKRAIDDIQGLLILEGDRYADDRGWFQELYSSAGPFPHLIGKERQVNVSCSKKGVVRGMHVAPFAKLCTCLKGRIYDVVADLRQSSPTYLKWFGIWLDPESKKQIYVPAGCAHGFFSHEEGSLFMYVQDGTYNPATEQQVNWKDPKVGIVWPPSQEYILSEKDKHAPMLS